MSKFLNLFLYVSCFSDKISADVFGRFLGRRPLCVHLYDLLDVLDLVAELRLCHPPDELELPHRPDHTQQTQKQKRQQQKQQFSLQQQRGARAKRAPPFIVSVPAVVSVSAVCDQVDQGDQVVPAHQVDDIDEVQELDPVHQVYHKDDHTFPHTT